MSLINDALRRASQSEKDRPRPASSPIRMEAAPIAPKSSVPLMLGAGIIVALLLAGWFFWQWSNARHPEKPVMIIPPPRAEVIRTVPPPVIAPPPVAVISVPSVPSVPPPAVEDPWPPNLKLKGIFFNRSHSHVLINGQTLAVGETVEGVRVLKIEKDQVTLQWKGRAKILMMDGS